MSAVVCRYVCVSVCLVVRVPALLTAGRGCLSDRQHTYLPGCCAAVAALLRLRANDACPFWSLCSMPLRPACIPWPLLEPTEG